ncbi:RES domain-containing protein [Arthrobacter sp. 2MCAF15]|uniref:RES domain-containing protein n=1 Tax=Arthrobacter sp. 2MCAF15 TaxID=3232984 RepID=UPI003F939740
MSVSKRKYADMPASKRKYPPRAIKLLWALSAGRCAFPGCRLPCIAGPPEEDDDYAIIGDIAHIFPHSPDGPRAWEPYSEDLDRNSYSNWILLCKNDHGRIDQHDRSYPAAWLFQIKMEHEKWIDERLGRGASYVRPPLPPVVPIDRVYRSFTPLYDPLQAPPRALPLGRFDDPFGEFGVLYAASTPEAVKRELVGHYLNSSSIPGDWIQNRKLAEIQTSGLRLFEFAGVGKHHAQQAVEVMLGEFADTESDLDKDRRVSQAAARWIHGLKDSAGSPAYDGIIFASPWHPTDKLVALFQRASTKLHVSRVTALHPNDFS